MRIVAGAWRGRALAAPPGGATRPTADRVRQAVFDMLAHAPWSPGLDGAAVLDGFAGTGALGLEALSRRAARADFIERDRAALAVLRANIRACGAGPRAQLHPADMLRPPVGRPCDLIFLDPPYGEGLLSPALAALRLAGWLAPGAVVVAEQGRAEPMAALGALLAERAHGAAMLRFWKLEEDP